jgi:hypothetical protein
MYVACEEKLYILKRMQNRNKIHEYGNRNKFFEAGKLG